MKRGAAASRTGDTVIAVRSNVAARRAASLRGSRAATGFCGGRVWLCEGDVKDGAATGDTGVSANCGARATKNSQAAAAGSNAELNVLDDVHSGLRRGSDATSDLLSGIGASVGAVIVWLRMRAHRSAGGCGKAASSGGKSCATGELDA